MKTSLITLIALFAMLIFGYLLGEYRYGTDGRRLDTLQESNGKLKKDIDSLTTRVHQLEAEIVIVTAREEHLQQRLADRGNEIRLLKDELAFYRRIMAPETTQDGFLLYGLQILPRSSEQHFRGSFILLQQGQSRAVVKGELDITIAGSLKGEPASIRTGDGDFLPDGAVKYRFKYFQPVEWTFSLPKEFIPETIRISTSVYQYTTKRGDYVREFDWQDVVEHPK